MIEYFNEDCMVGMARYPDKHFDLAIVDPPYGLARLENKTEKSNRFDNSAKMNEWDRKPTKEYFDELFRVSKRQIIWGANNFTLPNTEYFIVWDKQQSVDNFASAELAWTNVKIPAKIFHYGVMKMVSERAKEGGKIHPTQKPVALYKWLLKNYAKPGDKILDTHVGSASSLIACHDMGFDAVGFELDPDYYKASKKRLDDVMAQLRLTDMVTDMVAEQHEQLEL